MVLGNVMWTGSCRVNQVQIKGLILECLNKFLLVFLPIREERGRTLKTVEEMKGNRHRHMKRGSSESLKWELCPLLEKKGRREGDSKNVRPHIMRRFRDIWCWDTLGEALFLSKDGLRVYSWWLCTKDNGVDESIKSQTKRRISVQAHESFILDSSI